MFSNCMPFLPQGQNMTHLPEPTSQVYWDLTFDKFQPLISPNHLDDVTNKLASRWWGPDLFKVDFSYSRLNISLMGHFVEWLEKYPKLIMELSWSGIGSNELMDVLKKQNRESWYEEGRIIMATNALEKATEEAQREIRRLAEVTRESVEYNQQRNKKMDDLLDDQRKYLSSIEKCQKKIDEKPDVARLLSDLKGYRDTDDMLVEMGTSMSIANSLQDSEVIHRSRYVFQYFPTGKADLDGLVAGTLDSGEEVVVAIEAKHNMDTSYGEARRQLEANRDYISLLQSVDLGSLSEEEAGMLKDYEALCLKEHSGKRIMLAFGACMFSEDTIRKINGKLKEPWFCVVLRNERFEASIQEASL